MLTELEFKSLASQGYNRIPLMQEAFADLETPLSLYLKLAHSQNAGRYSFLLESVVGGERFGRYSFIGLPARGHLVSHGFGESAVTQVVRDGVVVQQCGVGLVAIRRDADRLSFAAPPLLRGGTPDEADLSGSRTCCGSIGRRSSMPAGRTTDRVGWR